MINYQDSNQLNQSNFTPLSINNNSSEVKSSFNKNFFYIVIVFFLFFIGFLSIITFLIFNKKSNNQNKNSQLTKQKSIFEDLSKYDKDSDGDGYPDFIEDEVGLNKNVSEAERCQQNSCTANLQTTSQKKNVLIILDASGSMDLLINGQKRMDLAKNAIKNYVNQSSNQTNIGLMIYGHKGSNNVADKPISCATAETIAGIGSVNPQNIDSILAPIKSTGWTLMGKAINEAAKAFNGKEGQNNEIILVTDGEETCDGNPILEASNIKNSPLNVSVNVIAFAVDVNATSSLIKIANAGGGVFYTASDGEELDRKFKELYQKGIQAYEFTKCKSKELETINNCYQEAYNKVDQFIQNEKKKYFDKLISLNEYQRLSDLSNKLFKQLFNFNNETLNKYNKTIEDVRNKAFEQ